MRNFFDFIIFLIGIPIFIGILWLVGTIFRATILNQDMEKENKYIQAIFSIIVGVIVIIFFGTITEKMGCVHYDDSLYRR